MKYLKNREGFTLIEILVAVLIFTIIASSLYFSIYVGLKSIKRSRANFEIFQDLRVCNRELQEDLRSLFHEPAFEIETFEGGENQLSLNCYKVSGVYKISYYQEGNSLFRSVQKLFITQTEENKEPIQLSEGKTYQLSNVLKSIKFEYLDSEGTWQTEWGIEANADYPKAVRIIFDFENDEKIEYKFQNTVLIPAGKSYRLAISEE